MQIELRLIYMRLITFFKGLKSIICFNRERRMNVKQLSTTLKVRLICDFSKYYSHGILPFIALYLTDMVNQHFSGLFIWACNDKFSNFFDFRSYY